MVLVSVVGLVAHLQENPAFLLHQGQFFLAKTLENLKKNLSGNVILVLLENISVFFNYVEFSWEGRGCYLVHAR